MINFFGEDFYFLWKSGNYVFSKCNFREREGFVVYIMYVPCIFLKVFSREMDAQQAAL